MYLDKDTVISLLDESDESYHDYLITLNLLPKDAIFAIEVEDIVTAEYYDEEKGIMYRIPIMYDYLRKSDIFVEYEMGKIDRDIHESILNEKYFKIKSSYSGKLVLYVFLFVLLVFIVLGLVNVVMFL